MCLVKNSYIFFGAHCRDLLKHTLGCALGEVGVICVWHIVEKPCNCFAVNC